MRTLLLAVGDEAPPCFWDGVLLFDIVDRPLYVPPPLAHATAGAMAHKRVGRGGRVASLHRCGGAGVPRQTPHRWRVDPSPFRAVHDSNLTARLLRGEAAVPRRSTSWSWGSPKPGSPLLRPHPRSGGLGHPPLLDCAEERHRGESRVYRRKRGVGPRPGGAGGRRPGDWAPARAARRGIHAGRPCWRAEWSACERPGRLRGPGGVPLGR